MRTATLTALVLTLCLLLPPASPAQQWEVHWTLDQEHTSVNFTVKHIVSFVTGRFNRVEGNIHFDPKDLEACTVDFLIHVGSVDTGVRQRDQHLLSEDFFDETDYPTISFASKKVRHVTGMEYEVDGSLIMRGISRDITIPITFLGVKKSPVQECYLIMGLESAFTIDRLEYGVGDGKFAEMGVVDKRISVSIYTELKREIGGCLDTEQ